MLVANRPPTAILQIDGERILVRVGSQLTVKVRSRTASVPARGASRGQQQAQGARQTSATLEVVSIDGDAVTLKLPQTGQVFRVF